VSAGVSRQRFFVGPGVSACWASRSFSGLSVRSYFAYDSIFVFLPVFGGREGFHAAPRGLWARQTGRSSLYGAVLLLPLTRWWTSCAGCPHQQRGLFRRISARWLRHARLLPRAHRCGCSAHRLELPMALRLQTVQSFRGISKPPGGGTLEPASAWPGRAGGGRGVASASVVPARW
jgi:hypothetical protein